MNTNKQQPKTNSQQQTNRPMEITDIKKLIYPSIIFTDADHKYTHQTTGENYTGVTTILKQVLFPDKYAGIPEDVLKRAAQRGTEIHEACQSSDVLPNEQETTTEVLNYQRIKDENNITMLINEYLVADHLRLIASKIDCVDTNLNLYDIKTTAQLDTEYVSWQLSIYAYLFEKQNPDKKAGDLYAIWLRGEKYKLVKLHRHSEQEVEEIFDLFAKGETKQRPDLTSNQAVQTVTETQTLIQELTEQINQLKELQNNALTQCKQLMDEQGLKKIQTPNISITHIAESKTTRLDTTRLQKENPDIYKQYLTETTKKASFRITLSSNS